MRSSLAAVHPTLLLRLGLLVPLLAVVGCAVASESDNDASACGQAGQACCNEAQNPIPCGPSLACSPERVCVATPDAATDDAPADDVPPVDVALEDAPLEDAPPLDASLDAPDAASSDAPLDTPTLDVASDTSIDSASPDDAPSDAASPLDVATMIDVAPPRDRLVIDLGPLVDRPLVDTTPTVDVVAPADVCAPPRSVCGGQCVDLTTSDSHCGACGRACPVAQQCRSGACAPCGALGQSTCSAGGCLSGFTACDGTCRDTQTDAAHCGACGRPCAMGMRCLSGLCQSSASAFVTTVSSFARAPDGAFRAWGSNNTGQLGDGTLTNRPTPAATMLPATAVEVVGGYSHTCARLMDGTVMCWGYNSQGQVGIGPTSTTARPTPAAVPGLSGVRSVTAGSYHTCAVRADGAVVCWGANNAMQLGTRDSAIRAAPTPVLGLTGAFTEVSAGISHTCARREDGAVFCWGLNTSGQLGNGTTTGTGPVMVTGVVAAGISAGYFNTCARLADGSARCWGQNNYGQIGDGSITMRPSPVVVRTAGPVAEIHVGAAFVCARLVSGAIQCWGYNTNGAIGDGTTTQRPAPTAVTGITDAVSLALDNSSHVCARLAAGALRCWGYNRTGAVGDGSVVNRLAPVVIPGV